MDNSSLPQPEPEGNKLSIAIQLLAATGLGALLPLFMLARLHTQPDPSYVVRHLPTYIVGFAAVGFCAGLVCVLMDVSIKGKERSKARGESTTKWRLLQLLAAILILPVVVGLCLIVMIMSG